MNISWIETFLLSSESRLSYRSLIFWSLSMANVPTSVSTLWPWIYWHLIEARICYLLIKSSTVIYKSFHKIKLTANPSQIINGGRTATSRNAGVKQFKPDEKVLSSLSLLHEKFTVLNMRTNLKKRSQKVFL